MGRDQPERQITLAKDFGGDGRMAMQFQVILHGDGDLGPTGLLGWFALVRLLLCLASFLRLLAGQITLAEVDFPAMGDDDMDAAALLLRDLLMVIRPEVCPAIKHHHVGPSVSLIGLDLGGDRFALQRPELLWIDEIGRVLKEIASELAFIRLEIKNRGIGADVVAVEQPVLEVMSLRRMLVLAFEELPPRPLLLFRGHGELANGVCGHRVLSIGVADLWYEIAKRQPLLDGGLGDAKQNRDLIRLSSFLDQPREGLASSHRDRVWPCFR